MKNKENSKYAIKVLSKTLKILELLGEKQVPLTATEISDMLGMNKASTFRILKNLEDSDFIERDEETARYSLGLKIYSLGMSAEPHTRLKKITRPFLEKLNQRCGETVHLAVLHRGEHLLFARIVSCPQISSSCCPPVC